MHDDRVQVVFSNYKQSLTPSQCEIFDRNVDYVKSNGVHVIVLNTTPQWMMPTSLENKNYSEEVMTSKRTACFVSPLACRYLKNGKFYPCTIADSIHNIGVADYKDDYVDLDGCLSREELRAKIKRINSLPYYESCGHCDGTGGSLGVMASKAGEQGYADFVSPKKGGSHV